uniref:Uncharacterized protein n=1 Tax=Serinus canaria TaxID=9135 RepID=A0A8C9NPT3_SERCA
QTCMALEDVLPGSCCASQGCPTYPWGCVLQVCGVHCRAQCHRARLCLLQVLLHLHQAQLQVHPLAFLPFAFFIYLLQPLLQTLVWEQGSGGKYILSFQSVLFSRDFSPWEACQPASPYIESDIKSDIPTKYRFFHSQNLNFPSTSSSHL